MVGATWSKAQKAALALCDTDYQTGIVTGQRALSGADLRGKAREYGASYAKARGTVLSAIRNVGIPMGEIQGVAGRRRLVWGSWAAKHAETLRTILGEIRDTQRELRGAPACPGRLPLSERAGIIRRLSDDMREAARTGRGKAEVDRRIAKILREG